MVTDFVSSLRLLTSKECGVVILLTGMCALQGTAWKGRGHFVGNYRVNLWEFLNQRQIC